MKSHNASMGNHLGSELNLVYSLTDFLKGKGFKVRHEVSNMGQSIDLVATKGEKISAIEVKKANWKKAVQQCRAHRLVADYVIVALAIKTVSEELSSTLDNLGLGLLLYDNDSNGWRWGRNPKKSNCLWKPQRAKFIDDLKGVHYAS